MLVQIDANALEWRSAVALSNDAVGIKELNEKLDVHSSNQKAFELPSRLVAKLYLFRTIYRGSGYAFAKDNAFSHVSRDPTFWDGINDKFYKKYSGLDRWHNSLAKLCAERKAYISPFGREFRFTPKDDGGLPWSVFTNYPVQSFGADIVSIARVSLFRRLKDYSREIRLISTVHDSIIADCPDKNVADIGKLMYECFNDVPKNVKKIWGIDLPIDFPGEVKVGKNLAQMRKVKYEEFLT